jgi:hypothetical protein
MSGVDRSVMPEACHQSERPRVGNYPRDQLVGAVLPKAGKQNSGVGTLEVALVGDRLALVACLRHDAVTALRDTIQSTNL